MERIASFETLRNINGNMGTCNSMTLVFFAAFFRFLLLCALMCDLETASSIGRNLITPAFYRDAESHSGKTISHHFKLQYRTLHYNDS